MAGKSNGKALGRKKQGRTRRTYSDDLKAEA